MSGRALLLACALAGAQCAGPAHAADSAVPLAAARAVVAEAAALCTADDGQLWGVTLCGPLMLADPATHAFAASRNDAAGTLHDAGGAFTGTLPKDQNVANAAVDWGGVRWTQIEWPLPEDRAARATLLM